MSEASKRPTLLTVLCILSFIASGLGILFGVLLLVGAAAVLSQLGSIPGLSATGGSGYLIGTLVLAGVQFYGVLQMWNLKKIGFFIYAGVQAVGIVLPLIFGMPFSAFGLAITALFVGLYYINLKVMS
jgi:FtsH-binding integral membrane protein